MAIARTAKKVPLHEDQIPLIGDLPSHFGDMTVIRDLKEREKTAFVPPNYVWVNTLAQLEECATMMREAKLCSVDTETTGLEWTDRVVCTGIYVANTAYIIPNDMVYAVRNFTRGEIVDSIGPALEDPQIRKVLHNAKYDIQRLWYTFGIDMQGVTCDTALAAQVLNENGSHKLEDLCEEWLESPSWKIKQDGKFQLWPTKMATIYLGRDVEECFKLYHFYQPELEQRPKLHSLLYDIEIPTMLVAVGMERRGMTWDQAYYEDTMLPLVGDAVKKARKEVQAYLGPVNVSSPEQISAALFDGLRLPLGDEGSRSTDKRALAHLRGLHPVVAKIEEYRKYDTIEKMFVKKLPKKVIQGKIHTNLGTCNTVTGRWTSSNPNLQQLPKRSVGPLVRRAFIPSPGCILVTMDYSQIELRILAHLSGDKAMKEAFESGLDFHTLTAHRMFSIPIDVLEADKDRAERITAKNINFGIPYGIGADKLVDTVNIQLQSMGQEDNMMTVAQGEDAIEKYYEAYPGVKKYIKDQKLLAHKQGFVETIAGRKRRLPEIDSYDRGIVSYAERQAVNSPIQGSAADMAKLAIIKIDQRIKKEHWPYAMLLQIHDEVVLEVPISWVSQHRETIDELSFEMRDALPLSVPVKVSVETLVRWGDKTVEDDFDAEEVISG